MARSPSHHPTEAELAILQVLWRRGPSTVREVQGALEASSPGYTTVLKLLQIMTTKGLVDRDEAQRAHVYRASVARHQVQRGMVRDLLDRLFEGSATQLVQQALSSRRASPEELDEIRRLLDDLDPPKGDR